MCNKNDSTIDCGGELWRRAAKRHGKRSGWATCNETHEKLPLNHYGHLRRSPGYNHSSDKGDRACLYHAILYEGVSYVLDKLKGSLPKDFCYNLISSTLDKNTHSQSYYKFVIVTLPYFLGKNIPISIQVL